MNTETIEYKDYTIHIEQDTSPSNPFEDGDCEPPLIVYYDGYLTKYGSTPDIADLVALIPETHFSRGNRVGFIKGILECTLREFAEERSRFNGILNITGRDSVRDTFAQILTEQCPEPGRSWGDATAHFETLEALCKLAGVPCYRRQSNGHCQGHSALVIAFATDEWATKVGAPEHTHLAQCKEAFDLYTAWAWGDCYGISRIEDPDGNEIEDGPGWGFYGYDHEKSGLLSEARATIDCDIRLGIIAKAAEERAEAVEAQERAFWEARDTVTAYA
jgi:hypothetical protein